ncbi:DUF1192 domain-containing protein [bacterium]|nr:DUF1192 domain-containing protein [bacterium]
MEFQFQAKQFKEKTEKQLLKQQIDGFLFCVNVFVNKITETAGDHEAMDDIDTLKRDLQSIKDKMDTLSIEELNKTISFLEETLQEIAMAFAALTKEIRVVNQ